MAADARERRRGVRARAAALAAASWLVGCGATTSSGDRLPAPSTGAVYAFPSADEVAAAAAAAPATLPEAPKEALSFDWTLTSDPVEDTRPRDHEPSTRAARLLALRVDAEGRPGVIATEAARCTASELARFLALHGRFPDAGWRAFVLSRCGSPASDFAALWLPTDPGDAAGDYPPGFEDAFARGLRSLLDGVRQAAESGAAEWPVEGGRKSLVAVVVAARDVELFEGSFRLPAAGRYEVSGKLLGPRRELVHALVNRGRFGVVPCQTDLRVAMPEFRIYCSVLGADTAAYLQIFAHEAGRALDPSVALLLLHDGSGASKSLSVVLPEAEIPPVALALGDQDGEGFRRAAHAEINRLRATTRRAPLRLEARQSVLGDGLVRSFLAAHSSGDQQAEDVAVLGMLAGWRVGRGMIRDGDLAVTRSTSEGSPVSWVSALAALPVGRAVFFDPLASSIAIGVAPDGGGGLAAMVASWSFFDRPFDRVAATRALLKQLERRRVAAGRDRIVVVSNGLADVTFAVERIERGEAGPEEALDDLLDVFVGRFGRSVRGWVMEVGDFREIDLPEPLLATRAPRIVAAVGRYRPADAAWGQHVVLLVEFL